MNNDDFFDSDDHDDDCAEHDPRQLEIQKLLYEMAEKAKKTMHYLILEGFIEPTDDPQTFKYTPEGFVLAQEEYKKLKKEGLL